MMEAIVDQTTLQVTVRHGQWVGKGFVSTDTYGGPYHQGILVVDEGDPTHGPCPVDPVDAAIEGYEIVTASDEAISLLLDAGYHIKGLPKKH
jgi:hypothetical protein